MTMMEVPSLYPEIEERSTPPGKGSHSYFKRMRDNWICTHISHPAAVQDMNFKGWIKLDRYGSWQMPGPGKGSIVLDLKGRPFSPAEEPWRLIFQHPDGAAEFSIEQIIAYRWHIRPPYREVRFPQLEGIEVFNLFCPECERGIFSSPREQEAADLLRQHLTSQFDSKHEYRPEDLRALGDEIGVDFFAARRRGTRESVRREGVSMEPENDIADMTPVAENTLICDECGAEFAGLNAGRQLQGHRMSHARARKAQAATV